MNLVSQPSIDQKRTFVQQEFARRAGGLGASSAGIGADVTNSPASGMPNEAMTNPPAPSGGAAGMPSDGTVKGMKQQKGEAQKLTDAMVWRMKKLTDRGE